MTNRERMAVLALMSMTRQFLQRYPDESIDSRAMSSGERTILALAEYGLMTVERRGRIWGHWNADAVGHLSRDHENCLQ